MCHHAWLIFVFLVETAFHHFGQAGLELQTSSDLPTLVSQNAGFTGMNHHAWLCSCSLLFFLAPLAPGLPRVCVSSPSLSRKEKHHSCLESLSCSIWLANFFFFFLDGVSLCGPGRSAMARSQLTATSASRIQAILLPQPPE